MASWSSVVLPPVGPAPGGEPATFDVPCSADPQALGSTTHPVTVRSDWSVETPHDLDAERVALAFGGYSSCLELVEKVVPAARRRVQLLARRAAPSLARELGGRWAPASTAAGCCDGRGRGSWATAEEAAKHVRSDRHQAALAGCRYDLLRQVSAALVRGHCGGRRTFPVADYEMRRADEVVVGPLGARQLWDVGLHPRLVPLIHQIASVRDAPLPMAFYLGVITRRPDLRWVRRTLEHVADDLTDAAAADTAEWLAWSHTDHDVGRPRMRGDFLELGLPWPVIEQLTASRVEPYVVREVADLLGFSPAFAAATVGSWLDAGVRLDNASEVQWLLACYRSGAPPVWRPSRAVLQALKSETRTARRMSAGRLCALLGVAGTVHFAAAAVNQGITDPSVLHGWLHGDAAQLTIEEQIREAVR